jgi:ATP-binding cassette subfamily B protein RaxB
VQTIQKTLTTQFVGAVLDGLVSILTLVLMAFYSVPLTLLVVGTFALYGLLRWMLYRPLRRTTEDHIVYAARQQSDLLESIRGIQAIKLANQQSHRQGRYANAQVDTTNREIALQRLGIGAQAGSGLLFGLARVGLIWWAAALVLKGEFSAGMLVAFIAYADQFHRRGAALIDRWNEFRMLELHAERVADIALSEPETHLEGVHGDEIESTRLEVRNLSFRYAEGEPWVLEHFNLTVEPGESVAIAAPSGAGKTTLAKLILGLLDPTEGEICFGGIDIRKLGLARYRTQVGAVMQDDQLFAGSIADNISLFDSEATPQAVAAAAHLAGIHEEIAALSMGYQTLVGDMGSSLSGGQRQRVLLARALYRKPRFLVLDEATSHLDVAREREINSLIKRLKITRLVLAHRPETLASADRVIVLGRGGVDSTAVGTGGAG